jgi:hypothetical protein
MKRTGNDRFNDRGIWETGPHSMAIGLLISEIHGSAFRISAEIRSPEMGAEMIIKSLVKRALCPSGPVRTWLKERPAGAGGIVQGEGQKMAAVSRSGGFPATQRISIDLINVARPRGSSSPIPSHPGSSSFCEAACVQTKTRLFVKL